MAYFAAVASVLQLLDDAVLNKRYPNSLLSQQLIVKDVHEKFTSVSDLLPYYSSQGDEVSDRVEGRIRDVAYRAQDIIEAEISIQAEETEETLKENVEDLQMVAQEIDSILEELDALRVHPLHHDSRSPVERGGEDILVGFDGYLTTIKDQICGQSSQLQFIAVIGDGGMGKTTLVKRIFDDPLVINHFDDYRIWITVSQDSSQHTVLKGILESVGAFSLWDQVDEFSLREFVYKALEGRKYLIVIDDASGIDVWDAEAVEQIFPNNDNGSRVMITSRLPNVAQYADAGDSSSDFVHQMSHLNEEDSWRLLQEKVFGHYANCPVELEAIGKSITAKCGGLPLAIVALAGVLSNVDTTEDDWRKIESRVSSILSKSDAPLLPGILSVCYHQLPHQLKACLLYMGGYPEGYEIKISNLIKLWIAEGFLISTKRSEPLEAFAEECLKDLVKRNLVMITKKRSNGQYKSCMLHDLVREFCRQRAFHEYLFHVELEGGDLYPSQVGTAVRRLINQHSILPLEPNSYSAVELVRSIRCYGEIQEAPFQYDELNNLKLLRVVDGSQVLTWSIPDEIFQMFHLSYLGLQLLVNVSSISPSISMLPNLQTLFLQIASSLGNVECPPEIWKMAQLRHLIAVRTLNLPLVPGDGQGPVQKLQYLQTLMTVLNFKFTNEAIEMISNLRKLKISCEEEDEVADLWEIYGLGNLIHLLQLEELDIKFKMIEYHLFLNPSNFSLPQNLRKLSLSSCLLPWKYITVVGSLPNLRVLKMRMYAFVVEEEVQVWQPNEGEFRSLTFLLLDTLTLQQWKAEKIHFPCLEHLKIRSCSQLEEIPLEIGDIPTLKSIDVYDCENAEDSARKIQENQWNQGNSTLQVRIEKKMKNTNIGFGMDF